MTTLVTERMLFLHTPKTGGTWVTAALGAAGVPWRPLSTRLGPGRRGHATLAEARAYTDRCTVAFVRHPLDLLRSRWADGVRHGWPADRLLHAERSDDFATFAAAVVERRPGFLGARMAEFTGPPEQEVDVVGRYESLVDDLVRALTHAGEPFDEEALRVVPPRNRHAFDRDAVRYAPALAERVAAAEAQAIARWYAHDPLPAALLSGDRTSRS